MPATLRKKSFSAKPIVSAKKIKNTASNTIVYDSVDFSPVEDKKWIKTLQKVSGKKDDRFILG